MKLADKHFTNDMFGTIERCETDTDCLGLEPKRTSLGLGTKPSL